MATVIKPSVGRVLWFYPTGSNEQTQPLPAIVSAVWGDRSVNLMVIAQNGVPMSHPPTSVTLVQEGDARPKQVDGTFYQHATWMPYQVSKAKAGDANSESAEPRLDVRRNP